MMDQYFGIKELQHVTLRAKNPMRLGNRYVEADEPILYFENVSLASLTENSRSIFARGGWQNLPHVTWEDRSEVHFSLQEGVMSSVSLGILLDANMIVPDEKQQNNYIKVPMRETFPREYFEMMAERQGLELADIKPLIFLKHKPILPNEGKKVFIMEYDRETVQKKIYGVLYSNPNEINPWTGDSQITAQDNCILLVNNKHSSNENMEEIYQDAAELDKDYVVDYYYKYDEDVLTYMLHKERFNGLFTLEGKFYSKDENEGKNYTNLIYMPKVRVMSDINLRLGERANPTVATFDIVGMPETYGNDKKSVIMEITRLNSDLDEEED